DQQVSLSTTVSKTVVACESRSSYGFHSGLLPYYVDGGGKRGQNSGGLVTFHSAPFPLGRGCSLRTARSGQGRAGVARRSEPFTARTVLRSSTRGKGAALNGPLKWPSRSPPLTGNAHLGILATRAPEKIHPILTIDFGGGQLHQISSISHSPCPCKQEGQSLAG